MTGQVIAHDGGWDDVGGLMPEFTVEFGKDAPAAGGRPPRRGGVPSQSRGDRAGARQFPARQNAATCWRSAAAPASTPSPSPAALPRSPGGRPTSTTTTCAASPRGARMRSSTMSARRSGSTPARPIGGSPRSACPRNSSRCSAPTSFTSRRGRWRKGCSPAPARHLAAGGRLFLYGPVQARRRSTTRRATPLSTKACAAGIRRGACATPLNRRLAEANGLRFVELIEMPSNNACWCSKGLLTIHVMAGLVPAIPTPWATPAEDRDGRDSPCHDAEVDASINPA